ncbi:MAG: response regulator [Spirochaetales bacterium]|nr:MAG: response regulator [Spirochaetales bacterium]
MITDSDFPAPVRAVICVDDEAIILMALGMELRKGLAPDFIVETAATMAEAVEVAGELRTEGLELACLITDWFLPASRGDAVAEALRVDHPGLPVVLMTGHSDTEMVEAAIISGGPIRVVRKPWRASELIAAVRDLIDTFSK